MNLGIVLQSGTVINRIEDAYQLMQGLRNSVIPDLKFLLANGNTQLANFALNQLRQMGAI